MLLQNSFFARPGQLLFLHREHFFCALFGLSAAHFTIERAFGCMTAATEIPAITLPPPEVVETSIPSAGVAAAIESSPILHGACTGGRGNDFQESSLNFFSLSAPFLKFVESTWRRAAWLRFQLL
jgi:hypothetical protein